MCTHVHTHSHAYAHTCTCAHTHAHTCRLTGPLGEQPWPYGTQGTGPGHIEGAQGSTPRPSVAIRIPGSLVPRSPPCLPPPSTLAQLTVSVPVPHFLGWRGSQAQAVRPGLVPGALPAQPHPPTSLLAVLLLPALRPLLGSWCGVACCFPCYCPRLCLGGGEVGTWGLRAEGRGLGVMRWVGDRCRRQAGSGDEKRGGRVLQDRGG